MKLQQQALAGVKWTGLASALNACSDIVRTVVLARFLSPVDYGLMAMAAIVIGFVQMYMDLGISAAIIHRQDTTRQQLSSLYWLNIFGGLAVFGAVWLATPWIPLFFKEPRILPLLKVMSVVFIVAPIGSQFEILLQKQLLFRLLARWEIVASFTATIVAIMCAIAGFGAWTLVFSFLANVSVKTLLLACVGFSRFRPALHFRRADLKGYVGFGLFQMGERSINYMAERLDQMLIGPILGAQALGFYNFALYLTAQPISRINPILTKVAFPMFSRIQDDTSRLRRGYIKLLSLLATVNAPLLVGLAAVAPWFVPVVFGAKWTPSVILVQILSFVSLSRCIGNPIGSLQLAKGRADLGFWWNVLLFACSVPAIYIGGKTGQATGVALALLVLQICLNVPSYLYLVRPLIGRCARDYMRATLKPVSLAAVMGLIIISLPLLNTGLSVIVELTLQIVLGALIYVSLLRVLNRGAIVEFQSALLSR
jgi:O-antigen/teichoic acid export membrane protein